MMARCLLLAALWCCLGCWLGCGAARARDADALWRIVHGGCVPDQQGSGHPAPCVSVDLSRGERDGSAVLKDRVGETQFLLIPTARITGIESPLVLSPSAPNYFAEAWAATALVNARLHRILPRDDLALAINSQDGRSQDQLHIHVDCIRADIHAALAPVAAGLDGRWRLLPMHLARHRYRAMWLPGDAPDANPFRLLAASLADPATEMGRHTLVLVGATRDGVPGFVLLDGMAGPLSAALPAPIKLGIRLGIGSGSGEELEDHACRIAIPPG